MSVIDSQRIAHSTSTCPDFEGPAIGAVTRFAMRLFTVCAYCEISTTDVQGGDTT